ncbi:MAG: hypothetical protein K8H88_12930 [Sandaracinaceae bacterium]|nr:hypothetical protein [Sandaracinaceae bacterium]
MRIGTPEGEPFATCTGRSVPANNPCEDPMSVRAGYSPDGTRVQIVLYGRRWMDLHGARYWIDAPIFPAEGNVVRVCEETYDDLWGGCSGPARVTECATSGLLTIDWNASGHVIATFEDGSSFEARW